MVRPIFLKSRRKLIRWAYGSFIGNEELRLLHRFSLNKNAQNISEVAGRLLYWNGKKVRREREFSATCTPSNIWDYLMVISQTNAGTNILLDSRWNSAEYLRKPQINNTCGNVNLHPLVISPAEPITCGRRRQVCLRHFYNVWKSPLTRWQLRFLWAFYEMFH